MTLPVTAGSMLVALVTGCSDVGLNPDRKDSAGGVIARSSAETAAEVAALGSDRHVLGADAVRSIASFPAGQSPEGIASDHRGNIYVGNRHRDATSGAFVRNEILHIDIDGNVTPIADLGPAPPGAPGLLGLATDSQGDVFAAFASFDPATRGVYRIPRGGSGPERLPRSENILFPNGLAFDPSGNLYVTDSGAGAVWRHAPRGTFALWIQHALLAPVAVPGFPPLPGANGVVYQPRYGLFVANTSQGTIVRISVQPKGGPGGPEVFTSGLLGVDGLTARHAGPLYFVNAGANLLSIPAVYGLRPETREVIPIATDLSWFDDPTSIAVGRALRDPQSVLVVNADIFPPTGPGAGVVQIRVKR